MSRAGGRREEAAPESPAAGGGERGRARSGGPGARGTRAALGDFGGISGRGGVLLSATRVRGRGIPALRGEIERVLLSERINS